jgi:hypothetical protein
LVELARDAVQLAGKVPPAYMHKEPLQTQHDKSTAGCESALVKDTLDGPPIEVEGSEVPRLVSINPEPIKSRISLTVVTLIF